MKFAAPQHVTGIFCSNGEQFHADDDGHIDVPDDASASTLASLQAGGWVRVADAAPPPKSPPVQPAKPGSED